MAEIDGKIGQIRKHGITVRGKEELVSHLKGKKLSYKQAVLAKCYECMGYYAEGGRDCEVPDCPLYGFMPRRNGGTGNG